MSALETRAHELQVEVDAAIRDRSKPVSPEVFLMPVLFSIALSLKRIADADHKGQPE